MWFNPHGGAGLQRKESCVFINPGKKKNKFNCNAVFEMFDSIVLLCISNFLNVFVTEKNGVCFLV